MDEEALVEAVRGFPSLWQPSSKSYKDVIAKENAWKLVAMQVNTFSTVATHSIDYTSSEVMDNDICR